MTETLPKLNPDTPIVIQGNCKIPLEMVEHLFRFLTYKELMVCYNVCVNWRRLVFDYLKKKRKKIAISNR